MSELIGTDSSEIMEICKMLDDAEANLQPVCELLRPSLMNEVYITDEELSLLLKSSRRTIQKWRTNGEIEYIQLGNGKIIYSKSAVEAFLSKNLRSAWAA